MQRPPVAALAEVGISLPALGPRPILGQRNEKFQARIITLQSRQVHLGQIDCRYLASPDQHPEFAHRGEGQFFQILGDFGISDRGRISSMLPTFAPAQVRWEEGFCPERGDRIEKRAAHRLAGGAAGWRHRSGAAR